jgi:trk system potassium uptake protein TrkH
MRPHVIGRYVGVVLLLDAVMLGISAAVSAWMHDDGLLPLVYTAVICALSGAFPLVFVPPAKSITNQEGLLVVVGGWVLTCVVGAVPYLMWGGEFTLINAWFESVSGFTTTGSTILTDIEALPKGLLFWRSATHFLGGIGIVAFALAVLPGLGPSSLVLYRAELSSLAREGFRVRARHALQVLLWVYLGLTVMESLALRWCGMDWFDAVTHSFGTIATGGFSPRNLSVAAYDSVAIELVIMLFMVVSGIHFGLLFLAARGRFGALWRSSITRYYLAMLVFGVGLVTLILHVAAAQPWGEAVRAGAFQVLSVGTTTGFATADSAAWPAAAQLVMLFLMVQCACAGSTSGGVKVDRFLIFFKTIGKQVIEFRYPKAVVSIKIDRGTVEPAAREAALLFAFLYVFLLFLSSLALSVLGVDLLSSVSAATATMGNVGPGFGAVGSMGNFAHLPGAAKFILTGNMLCGRLEIFALLVLLAPRWWQR